MEVKSKDELIQKIMSNLAYLNEYGGTKSELQTVERLLELAKELPIEPVSCTDTEITDMALEKAICSILSRHMDESKADRINSRNTWLTKWAIVDKTKLPDELLSKLFPSINQPQTIKNHLTSKDLIVTTKL